MMLLHTNIAGFTKVMTIATSKYIMVYKSACVCKLRSFTQKGVRKNYLVLFTRMCNSWMTIKKKSMQIMKIDYCNFGLSMNALIDYVSWFMNRDNDNKVMKAPWSVRRNNQG